MYTHTLIILQQMSQHSQHQSTARILVPSGPFGLAEHGLLFQYFFLLDVIDAPVHPSHTVHDRVIYTRVFQLRQSCC